MARVLRPAVEALVEVWGEDLGDAGSEVRVSDVGWLWLRTGVRLALAVERDRLRLALSEVALQCWEEAEVGRVAAGARAAGGGAGVRARR